MNLTWKIIILFRRRWSHVKSNGKLISVLIQGYLHNEHLNLTNRTFPTTINLFYSQKFTAYVGHFSLLSKRHANKAVFFWIFAHWKHLSTSTLSREHIPNHTPLLAIAIHVIRCGQTIDHRKSTALSNFMMLFNLIICLTNNWNRQTSKDRRKWFEEANKKIVRYAAVRLFQTVAIPIFVSFIQIGTVR